MAEQSQPTLLLTRPNGPSQRFAQAAAARFGHLECIISPVLEPMFLTPSAPPAACASIFTSETGVDAAVRAWPERLPKLAYCVGDRTAQAAAAAGFDARSAQGDWRDLAALIVRDAPKGPLAFLCAAQAPQHLQTMLTASGFSVERVEVYTQIPRPLSDAAQLALMGSKPVLLPLFSPRSANLFCGQAGKPAAPIWLAAMSKNVAEAFTLPTAQRRIADRPNVAAILDAMGEILNGRVINRPLP